MKKTSKQTLGEEIANSISHGVMAIFGIVSLILLLIKNGETRYVISSIIFSSGIILLYVMSSLYHAFTHQTTKHVFKIFDHLSIYILIGSTFAPFLLLSVNQSIFNGLLTKGEFIFIIQWSLIVLGVVMKSIWIKKYSYIHLALFLLMGWSALFFIKDIINLGTIPFVLVLLGGVSYTIGVFFYVFGKVKYFHFVWHIFVALGTILHFIAIYLYVY